MNIVKARSLNNTVKHWLNEYKAAKALRMPFAASRAWRNARAVAAKAPGYVVAGREGLFLVTRTGERGGLYGRCVYKTRGLGAERSLGGFSA